MFKIKLLILLLSSILVSCATSHKVDNPKIDLNYIAGGVDGLIMNNMLANYLQNYNLYDKNSNFKVDASISHNTNFFITNIDNTSDRENVSTRMDINIIDKNKDCVTFSFSETIDYFYIYASSETFSSNQKALEEIRFYNTETLIKKFIVNLTDRDFTCFDEK